MGLDNPVHLAFLLILLLLVFGAKRLPELGRSLGSGMRGFKDAIGGDAAGASQTAQEQPAIAAASVSAPADVHAGSLAASAESQPAR